MTSTATGKRSVDEEGATEDLKKRRMDLGVFDIRKMSCFPEYLRARQAEMGKVEFAEWLGFGVETPETDVANFNEWKAARDVRLADEGDDQRAFRRSEDNGTRCDLAVHLQSQVVPLEGKEDMKALLKIEGLDKEEWDGGMKLSGKVDMFVLFDGSGSMRGNVEMLRDAVINMADKDKDLYDKEQAAKHQPKTCHAVHINFAYGVFGCEVVAPGLDDHPMGAPVGYTPWMPLHDMKACMRNVAQTIRADYGSTNLSGAVSAGLKHLLKRREDEDLPHDHMQHLLIMTDGMPNTGQTAEGIAHLITTTCGNMSVVVHVLALGTSTDMDLCKKLSVDSTRGLVGHADCGEALTDAFESIMTPIRKSARPFTVEINDKGSRSRTLHYGILTKENSSAVTTFNFNSKLSPGCHIAATAGLQGATPTCVAPMYAKDGDDPVWKSPGATEPKLLTDALEAERLFEEHKRKVEAEAEANGMQAALGLSAQLTAQYTANGMGMVPLMRVNAFHAELDRTVSTQTAIADTYGGPPPSALGRGMSVAAASMRSSYSQSY